jgi:hypothetical protein
MCWRKFWGVLVPCCCGERGDRHCLRYEGRRKTNKEKKGKWEAVRVGRKVICSQLSCASGRVEREGEGRGERQDEMTKKNELNAWLTSAPIRSFRSDPSLNTRPSLHRIQLYVIRIWFATVTDP